MEDKVQFDLRVRMERKDFDKLRSEFLLLKSRVDDEEKFTEASYTEIQELVRFAYHILKWMDKERR